jgi:hypothetical protein
VIHLQLAGRLGNHLFQWATALSIQNESQPIVLTYDDFHQSEPSNLLRKVVGETIGIKKSNLTGRLLQLEDKFFLNKPLLESLIYTETNPFGVYEHVRHSTFIARGYFQNWRNLASVEELITSQLEVALSNWINADTRLMTLRNEIGEFHAVHVRQGDYLGSDFGTLSSEYYKGKRGKFLLPVAVFTDQSELNAKYFDAIQPDFVFTRETLSADDSFALMSQASSITAANSTFSWWAGFLIAKRNGDVTIPNPWMKAAPISDAFIYPKMQSSVSIFN